MKKELVEQSVFHSWKKRSGSGQFSRTTRDTEFLLKPHPMIVVRETPESWIRRHSLILTAKTRRSHITACKTVQTM